MKVNLNIRAIKSGDNLELAKIIRAAFVEFDAPKTGTVYSDPTTDHLFELFDAEPNASCFVAELNGTIVGCCGIFPTDGLPSNYAELVKFYLTKTARGKGVGKALFERSIQEARKMNYTHLYIESQPSFDRAVKLYESYGFDYLDQSLGNSGHDNCNVWMIKKL